MQIHVNTDKTISQHNGLDEHVQQVVSAALDRFGEHITRVDVHVSNDLAQKGADGANRCMMEARVNGYQPVAVTDHAVNLHQAINGAADKLKRALDSALGKLNDAKRHAPSLADLSAAQTEE